MKIATPSQTGAMDACAKNEYGIPGMLLMENAAAAVAAEAVAMMGGCRGRFITAVAGRGNNGGDAFAAARLLNSRGVAVHVWLTDQKTGISGDALLNLQMLERIGVPIFEISGDGALDVLSGDLAKSDIILDGIFGTGLTREVGGIAAEVIGRINTSGRPVLSIDIPSGVDGADGCIRGICVSAAVTVTFTMPKVGLILHPGCEHTGRLVVAEIGIPEAAVGKQGIVAETIERDWLFGLIPPRTDNSNKGTYGRVFIVTGSKGMTGSGCLASMAALRTGAGLVYAGVPESLAGIYGASVREPIILPLKDGGIGCLSSESAGEILSHMERMDAAVIGPGLTAAEGIQQMVKQVVMSSRIPLVLDADALNVISREPQILKNRSADAVVTPHPGEMARLTGLTIQKVQKDRIGTAVKFAAEYNVTTVLKGSRTIVAQPDGHVYVNTTGNAGMATAGTGDVLAGIIGGLIAQGVPTASAAAVGVYLHGLAGDAAAGKFGLHGMLAGDVVDELPYVMKRFTP